MFLLTLTKEKPSKVLSTDVATCRWLGAPADSIVGREVKEVLPQLSVALTDLGSQAHGSRGHCVGVFCFDVAGGPSAVEICTVDFEDSVLVTLKEFQSEKLEHPLLRGLGERSGELTTVVDREGRFLLMESYLARGLDYGAGHLRGKQFSEFLHPDDVDRTTEAFHLLWEGRALETECRFRDQSGEYRWIRWQCRPPLAPQSPVFGTARDVTVERAAQDFDALVSEAMARIEQGVVMTDATGHVRWCNAQFERITGYRADEMLGRRLGRVLQGEATDAAEVARVRDRIRAGRGFRTELLNYRKSGEKYWVRIEAEPTVDAHGNQFFVAIETDITWEKTERERVRASEARLRSAINGAQEAIYWMDAIRDEAGEIVDFLFTEVNRAAEVELGKSRGELIGGKVCELFPVNRTGGFFEQYKRVVESGIPLNQEYEIPDGEPASGVYRHHVVKVLDGVAIFNTNLTEQRRQAAARELAEQELQRSQRMEALGRLAGGIAHDFNNVLATIMSAAESLNARASDPESAQTINDIIEASSRAGEFISEIMAFSRRGELARKVIFPGQVIESTVRMLRRMLPRGIHLDLHLDRDVAIWADSAQLEQVLTNLVTNSWHAMSSMGGQIQISLERLDSHRALPRAEAVAVITVSDDGPGMSKEILARVREPFFSTKEPGMGTGLGLSVVDRIVASHEGRLVIESEVGRGTTVKIVLPALTAEPEPKAMPPASTRTPQAIGLTVLLVDDERVLRSHIAAGLSHFGFTVHAVETGEEAISATRRLGPDLAIAVVDYDLQTTNGVRLAERLRGINPELRVLLLTGGGVGADVGGSEVVDKICFKPISLKDLAREVELLRPHRPNPSVAE